MPHALLALAGEHLGSVYRRLLRRYTYGPATVKVDWALDGPIPWLAEEVRGAGTVHVGGGEDELVGDDRGVGARLARTAVPAARPADGRRPDARAGRPAHRLGVHARPPRGVDWAGELDRHVQRMEAQVERYAPGFRDRILARHVLGPAGLQERNRNLVGGDVGGGSYRLDQVIFRPAPSLSPYRTPLRGLYLGSSATFPGGAVHGVCGDAAANAALADESAWRRALRAPRPGR